VNGAANLCQRMRERIEDFVETHLNVVQLLILREKKELRGKLHTLTQKKKYFTRDDIMEPIAEELKKFLETLGFAKKKTIVNIKYDSQLVKGKVYRTAHITIDGPIEGAE